MGGTDSATPTLTAAPFPEQAPAGLGITPGQGTDLPPPWKGAEWKVKGESLTGGKERGWWRASMLMPLFKPSLALLGNDVLGKGEQLPCSDDHNRVPTTQTRRVTCGPPLNR